MESGIKSNIARYQLNAVRLTVKEHLGHHDSLIESKTQIDYPISGGELFNTSTAHGEISTRKHGFLLFLLSKVIIRLQHRSALNPRAAELVVKQD